MNRINYTQDAVQKYEALSKKLTETMMAALKSAHSAAAPGSMDPEDLNRQRIGQDVLGRLITPPIGFGWEPFTQDDIPMAWVRPERSHDKRRAILYCHGGGYTSGNLGYARVLAAKLASATGYEVLSFQYRLSPEYPYPAALKDARATWDFLMRQGWGARDIILAGDSAGGNLALELILSLREEKRFLPGRLLLFSPWTDMTASGPSYQECEKTDPILTSDYIHAVRSAYAPDADWSLPCFSPIMGDLTGFPPTLIQVGEREILRSDSVRLLESLSKAGVPCVLEQWPEMWHVFQMFPIKTAGEALVHVAAFLQQLD